MKQSSAFLWIEGTSSREAIDIRVLEGVTPYQCEENGAYCVFWKRPDFFNMKTLQQLLLAQLHTSKCVLFKNNLLQSEIVPLIVIIIYIPGEKMYGNKDSRIFYNIC